MDRFSPDTNSNSSNPVGEQVPHSGVHHNEKPDFPGQPDLDVSTTDALAEKGAQFGSVPQVLVDRSLAEGLVLPSSQPSTPEIAYAPQSAEKQKTPLSRGKKIGFAVVGGVAAVAAAVPAFLGLTGQGNENPGTPPIKTPDGTSQVEGETNEQPEKPVDTSENGEFLTLEGEALSEHFKIPAGLSAEDFAETLTGLSSDWAMLGANETLAADALSSSGKIYDFVSEKSQSATPYVVTNLFTAEALNDADVQNFIANSQDVNTIDLEMRVRTSPEAGDSSNEEAYVRSYEVVEGSVSETVNEDGSRVITYQTRTIDNGDKNSSDEQWGEVPNGVITDRTVTVVNDGDLDKISGLKAALSF